ncbi:MAG: tRNA glutamyl-Q(34) synthetase GluQRS, partial [Limisphaerales bacterium]
PQPVFRFAPSPNGELHLGHAYSALLNRDLCCAAGGRFLLRIEDIDRARCKPEFVQAIYEDLGWFGFEWQEGPDRGGFSSPYTQTERLECYRRAFETLKESGFVYPCKCSRQEVMRALSAPHAGEEEPIYPGTCREFKDATENGRRVSWRFRVPDSEAISFLDGNYGEQTFLAGKDFGDFVVWRHDGVPSYQLACVTDDAAMQITEVVRGADLLLSTARQILLYRALNLPVPSVYHCPLMTDETGVRLAKRNDALSLRRFRECGISPDKLRAEWAGH